MLADRQFSAVQMLEMSTASGGFVPWTPTGAHKQAPGPHAWQNVPMHVHVGTNYPYFNNISIKMADFHALCVHFQELKGPLRF